MVKRITVLLVLSVVGCGDETGSDAVIEVFASETDDGLAMRSPGTAQPLGIATTLNKTSVVKVNLNNLEALTEVAVPYVADYYDIDEIDLDRTTLASGEFEFLGCNYDYEVRLDDFDIDLNIDAEAMSAKFKDSDSLKIALDLENADASADFQFVVEAPSVLCPDFDIPLAVSAEDLEGEITVTLQKSSTGISVKSVDALSLDLDNVEVGSEFTTDATEAVIDIANFVGAVSCSSLDGCASDLINDQLSNATIKSSIKTVINNALAVSLSLDGSVSQSGVDLDYAIELKSFEGDESAIDTKWNVDLTSNAKADGCGGHLSYTSTRTAKEDPVAALDVTVPYRLIGQAILLADQQGVFCQTLTGTMGTGPAVMNYSATVRPQGTLEISASARVEDVIVFSLPIVADVSVTRLGRSVATGSMSGTALLRGEVKLDEDTQTLRVEFLTPVIQDFSGSVTARSVTLDASDLSDDIQSALDDAELETIVLPKVVEIAGDGADDDIGLYLRVQETVTGEDGFTVGFGLCRKYQGYDWSTAEWVTETSCIREP